VCYDTFADGLDRGATQFTGSSLFTLRAMDGASDARFDNRSRSPRSGSLLTDPSDDSACATDAVCLLPTR
jgi:hypothetical protein